MVEEIPWPFAISLFYEERCDEAFRVWARPKIWLGLSGYQFISLAMAGIGLFMLWRRSKFMLAPTSAGGSLAP